MTRTRVDASILVKILPISPAGYDLSVPIQTIPSMMHTLHTAIAEAINSRCVKNNSVAHTSNPPKLNHKHKQKLNHKQKHKQKQKHPSDHGNPSCAQFSPDVSTYMYSTKPSISSMPVSLSIQIYYPPMTWPIYFIEWTMLPLSLILLI
eukprot:222078_1